VFELGAVIKSFQVRGHGGIGIPAMSHYIPTKMGIIGFMRGLANDVANDGVTANAMDNSPPCFPQRVEKGIYNSESAEDVDFEFAPDSVKRQYLQGLR
jgi:NAD(P)-dependent dehydrogenase (short-subunit alcohol dehydrogenase family)